MEEQHNDRQLDQVDQEDTKLHDEDNQEADRSYSTNVLLYWLIGVLFVLGIIAFAMADRGGPVDAGGGVGEGETREVPARLMGSSDQLPA